MHFVLPFTGKYMRLFLVILIGCFLFCITSCKTNEAGGIELLHKRTEENLQELYNVSGNDFLKVIRQGDVPQMRKLFLQFQDEGYSRRKDLKL